MTIVVTRDLSRKMKHTVSIGAHEFAVDEGPDNGGEDLGPTPHDVYDAALGACKAIILRNHGLLTVGGSVDEAAWWFITMERSCQAQLIAEAAGKPVQISHENALVTRNQVAGGINGWFQFQPMWQMISRAEPDIFE